MWRDLIGVKQEKVGGDFYKSINSGMKALSDNPQLVVAYVDSNGAIDTYIDDEGVYRGYRYRNFETRSFIVTMKKTELRSWLSKNLKKIC